MSRKFTSIAGAVKHPVQPVVEVDGIHRFKENKIVRQLLKHAQTFGVDLNTLSSDPNTDPDDYEQLMQLIGYSVSGFCDLSCATDRVIHSGQQQSDNLRRKREAETCQQSALPEHLELVSTETE